jgi:hypothetical protein
MLVQRAFPQGRGAQRLDIAEGVGEHSRADQGAFALHGQRSGTESAAILDVAQKLEIISGEPFDAGRGLLFRIVSMLEATPPTSGVRADRAVGHACTPFKPVWQQDSPPVALLPQAADTGHWPPRSLDAQNSGAALGLFHRRPIRRITPWRPIVV